MRVFLFNFFRIRLGWDFGWMVRKSSVNYHPIFPAIPEFEASLFDDADGYYWPCSETFPKFLTVPDNDGVEDKEQNMEWVYELQANHHRQRAKALRALGRTF